MSDPGRLDERGHACRHRLDELEAGDVLTATRLDRLARSTRDLPNTLAIITGREAGFQSLGDARADIDRSAPKSTLPRFRV